MANRSKDWMNNKQVPFNKNFASGRRSSTFKKVTIAFLSAIFLVVSLIGFCMIFAHK